ncbi:hypothetical protein HYH02_011374 [Chlamydomonas schloesseri]|uniref:Uncharacterized protein n=1 Tax=Chlamydomonas schloesseri TaxID=2026947 RepID=A0A835T6J6_9CHLO|nr:hypothetical protein HYH02_011374 [Chlamydomonas schloesseri]|eukprot:KAG2437118.1 hypothetical protein HYH02_011374 [Chlamydomonas schloesseri]
MSQNKGFSSKVLGLKFMQRAVEKRKLEADAAAADAAADAAAAAEAEAPAVAPAQATTTQSGQAGAAGDAAWPQASTSGRCIISYEPVPLPGLVRAGGRMSFGPGGMKKTGAAAAAASATEPSAAAAVQAAAAQQGASISDVDMAKTFRKPAELKPWQPSTLRIIDDATVAAGSSAGSGSGGGLGGGSAKSQGQGGKKSAGGGGGASPAAAGKSGKGAAAPNANAFAPLRPPKKQKT